MNKPQRNQTQEAVQKIQQNSGSNLKLHMDSQEHITSGQYIKSAVYGGLDGIITVLSIAFAGVGSGVGPEVIVAIGISSLIADGLSMAVADYLATKSDDEYMKMEEQRERQEIQHDFQSQKREMKGLYVEMGLKPEVSQQIVDILSTDKQGFLKVMMIEELQLIADEQNPIRNSIVTFISFCLFGIFPLIPYFIADSNNTDLNFRHSVVTAAIGIACLIVLGLSKSVVTGVKAWFSVLQTLLIAGAAVGVAYGIGVAFGQ